MWPELSYKAIKGSDERDCAQVHHQSKDGDNYVVWSRQTGQLDKVRSAVIQYLLHFIICCLLSAWPKKFRLSEAQRQTDLFVLFDQVPSEVYSKTEVLVESNVCVVQEKSLWGIVLVWHCPWCWTCISGSHSRSHQCRPGSGSCERRRWCL